MAMYYCEGCENMMDDDYFPMSSEGVCPECQAERDEEESEDE